METLGNKLKGKSYGVFQNNNGEYCRISTYYIRNKKYISVYFNENDYVLASRNAIRTTSEKKVLKLLEIENFTYLKPL
jgi:hypothetical protein